MFQKLNLGFIVTVINVILEFLQKVFGNFFWLWKLLNQFKKFSYGSFSLNNNNSKHFASLDKFILRFSVPVDEILDIS